MVKGEYVLVKLGMPTPEELASQSPGTYQTENDVGVVLTDPYIDVYGVSYNEVLVWKSDRWRQRRIPTRDLSVVERSRLAHVPEIAFSEVPKKAVAPRYFGEPA